nr:MAG TPA: hypothetical protein [Caudoviricetes sp.]
MFCVTPDISSLLLLLPRLGVYYFSLLFRL